MSRKDYQKTAEILKRHRDEMPADTLTQLILDFAVMFKEENSNFDLHRFERAVRAND